MAAADAGMEEGISGNAETGARLARKIPTLTGKGASRQE